MIYIHRDRSFGGLLVSLLVALSSCDETQSTGDKLIGNWKLVSQSNPLDSMETPDCYRRILFKNDGIFQQEWMCDDVGGGDKGTYFIVENPSRHQKTVVLVDDIQQLGLHDTLADSEVFDVLSVNDSLMMVRDETVILYGEKWKPYRKSGYFNRVRVFKRIPLPREEIIDTGRVSVALDPRSAGSGL
jgi:hypothetical protein